MTFSGVESLLTGRVHWGKVGQTEWDLGQQIEKQGRDEEAVDSFISELGLGPSEQSKVCIEA